MKLTEMEIEFLRELDAEPRAYEDSDGKWIDNVIECLSYSSKKARGVISSLVQKNILFIDESLVYKNAISK